MLQIALVDYVGLDFDDGDREPLLAALEARGLRAAWWSWDDPSVDWSTTELAVIRMAWNYTEHHDDFLDWIDRAEALTNLLNPAAVMRWNSHKSYLVELAEAGVPVVPTTLVRRGDWPPAALDDVPWDEVVVKPAVDAGARGAFRAPTASLGATVPAPEVDVLVQPLVPSITTDGETSLMFIDGAFSHAVCKRPADGDYRVQLQFGGKESRVEPSDLQLEVADRALGHVDQPLLYARVDLVEWEGTPHLMELELIEPSMFLGFAPEALDHFAAAIEAALPSLDDVPEPDDESG